MTLLCGGRRSVTPPQGSLLFALVLAGLSGAVSSGCGGGHVAPRSVAAPPGVVCDYQVWVGPDLALRVAATFVGPIHGELSLDDAAMDFVDGVTLVGATGRSSVPRGATGYALRCSSSCRVEYRFRLRDAAARVADVDTAIALGGAVVAPPSTWLLRPTDAFAGRYRFRVETPSGIGFVTGVRASAAAPGAHEGDLASIGESAFSAFGALRTLSVAPGIDAAIVDGVPLHDDDVAPWLRAELAAIAAYLGRAPDDRLVVIVAPGTSDVIRGKTLGGGGASILVRLGTATTTADLASDWVVAHELVHVGFPALDYEHGWFSEGLATYVEPVARARRGLVSAEQMWTDLLNGLPQGLPGKNDRGLEGAEEWGRVYWGGALYFLLADLAIRDATGGRRSLEDAIRAVAATGANVETRWKLQKILDVGDRATETHVMQELYARYGRSPASTDLEALRVRLGVERDPDGRSIHFVDTAPWARFRKSITAKSDGTREP